MVMVGFRVRAIGLGLGLGLELGLNGGGFLQKIPQSFIS